MRQIGHLPDESQARLFGDYLFARDIRNQVESEGPGGWVVWVHDDDQLEDASRLLENFRQNPASTEFKRAAGTTDQQLAEEERQNKEWRRRFFNRQKVFPGQRSFGAGPVTFALIVLCVGVSVLSGFGSNLSRISGLFISEVINPGGVMFPEVRSGQIWRLITPIFIHFGIPHLLFNMLWLFQLGSMIERLQGWMRLLLLIGVIAVVSNTAQYVFTGSPAFGGMSGVVYGLFGYIWIRGKFDPASGLFIDQRSVILMIVWFVLCFTGLVGPIANIVHAGGLIVGTVWGWASALRANRNP